MNPLSDAYRHLRHGEYGLAASAAQGTLDDGGDEVECRLVWGRAELGRGRLAAALDQFDKAVAADSGQPRAHAWRVAALDRARRDGEAQTAADAALAAFPDSVEVQIAAGRLNNRRLDYRGGLARFAEALRVAPDDVDAQEWHAAGLRWTGQYEAAIDALAEPIRRRPTVQRLIAEQGHNLCAIGRHQDALAQYSAALDLDSHDRDTLESFVDTLRDLGRWDEAEVHLRELSVRLPHEAWPYVLYADHLERACHYVEALAQYGEALRRQPGMVEAIVGAADMEVQLGRPDDAYRRIEAGLGGDVVECRARLLVESADTLTMLDRWEEALAIADGLLAENPHYVLAMRLRVDALNGLGRVADALEARSRYCASFPQQESLRVDLAWLLAETGQPVAALQHADAASVQDPQYVRASLTRIRMLARLSRTDEAIEAAEAAIECRPYDANGVMELAWIFADAGRTKDALQMVERALGHAPYHRHALAWRVTLLRRLSRWQAAETAAAEAVNRLPDFNTILMQLLEVVELRGRARDVETLLRRQLERRPGDIWLLLRLIDVYQARGRHVEVLGLLDELASRYDTANAVAYRVRALTALRRYAEAESAVTTAIERFGRHRDLLVELTTVYERTGRLVAAMEIYREILAQNPDDVLAVRWQIIDLRDLDLLDEAEDLARRARLRRPYVTTYHAQLAWTLHDRGQYELARQEFEDAQALDPDDAWLVIGEIQMSRRQHRLVEAEARAREALMRWPDSDDVRIELGLTLDELNEFDGSLAEFDAVLRGNIFDADCVEAKSAVLRSMRRFDDAERLIRQLIDDRPHRQSACAELGWIQRDRKQYSAAVLTFAQLLRDAVTPDEVLAARCGLGWVARDQWQLDASEVHFRAALQAKPQSTGARLGTAWVLVRRNDRGRDAEAERLCLDVLARRPFNHEAHTCLGVLNFQCGQLSVAGYHLRRAVEIDPYRGSHVDLGSFLAKLERLDDAEASLRRALEIDADDAQAHIELGNVFLQRAAEAVDGDTRHATQAAYHFRQARLAQPDSGAASLGLALALAGGGPGGLVAAEGALRNAVTQPACDIPRWHLKLTLARLMVQQGDLTQRTEMFEEALDFAIDAIREAPSDPAPHFVAGLAEFKLGEGETSYLRPWRRHRARNYLRQCIRLDRSHVEARRTVRALDRAGRLARPAMIGSTILTTLATAVLVTMWIGLFGHTPKIDRTMVIVLTPIMIGLVALSIVLPSIVRLRLPGGVEADLYASLNQISAGPTGEDSVGPGRLSVGLGRSPVSEGPVGRQPRQQ